MLNLPEIRQSYWQQSAKRKSYPKLRNDIATDVIIVGGGITGLTVAYLLKQAGKKVVVLEKNTLGSGTTGHTTGKVTSQHNLVYASLKEQLGVKMAQTYADANQFAVEQIAQIIKKEGIKCDWQSQENFVYTTDKDKIKDFKLEAKVATKLGLPASFVTNTALPFKVQAAVKFSDQASMNAQKYVMGLAELVEGNGSYVFERSNVTNFHDGQKVSVSTKEAKVVGSDLIVATKIPAAPLVARFSYAVLEHPHTSYIVAGTYKDILPGMYISPDKDNYSILPIKKNNLLLIGGENHTPGLGIAHRRLQRLANYAELKFGITSIEYAWKAMDYIAYDDVPLIGEIYPWSRHTYTATGFKKWGLSTSMVAGIILRDTILGKSNPWAKDFNSMRMRAILSIPSSLTKALKDQ